MKYCKKCGVLYSSGLPCCPKCNPAVAQRQDSPEAAPEADPRLVRRQWIALCVGIPALIGVLYLVVSALRALG